MINFVETFFNYFTTATVDVLSAGKVRQKNFILDIFLEFRAGVPVINVQIQNKNYKFLFDTAALSVVSKKIINECNLEPHPDTIFTIDAAGKESQVQVYTLSSLKIEVLDFNGFIVLGDDFSAKFPISCMEIDGIFGYNFLQKLIVKLEYKNKKIVLSDMPMKHEKYVKTKIIFDGKSGAKFPINFGDYKSNITIDSGKNDGILIGDQKLLTYFLHKNFFSKKTEGIFRSTFSSKDEHIIQETFLVKNFTICHKIFIDLYPIELDDSKQAIAGNSFLKLFDIIIDFKKKYAYFKTLEKENISQDFYKSFGFFTYWNENEKLYVSALQENSPAFIAGVQIGDRILSIDNKNVYDFTQKEYCDFFLLLHVDGAEYELKNSIEIVIKRDSLMKKMYLTK